jgi:hypothetical protein
MSRWSDGKAGVRSNALGRDNQTVVKGGTGVVNTFADLARLGAAGDSCSGRDKVEPAGAPGPGPWLRGGEDALLVCRCTCT